jgi:hypothetical protein
MVLLPNGSAYAAMITVNALDQGWYNDDGEHFPLIENYAAGICVPCSAAAVVFRNFFIFDLSGVSGPVTSATLRLSTRNFLSGDLTETYTLFDVSTPLASLAAGTGGVAAFNDLGGGVSYGSRIYSESDDDFVRDILLGPSGVAAVQAALGGGFGIGGAVTSLSGNHDFESIFGENSDPFTISLVLNTGRAVPEPATMMLVGTALACLAVRRRRRRSFGDPD